MKSFTFCMGKPKDENISPDLLAEKQRKEDERKKKIKETIETLKIRGKEFCNTTSIHGFNHLVDPTSHPSLKALWLFCIVFMASFAGYVCLIQVNRFASPTVVSVKKDYRQWQINYPAITVCLADKYDAKLVDKFIEKMWNVTQSQDLDRYLYLKKFVELVASASFRSNLRLFWKFEKDTNMHGIDLLEIVEAVSPPVSIRTSLHKKNHPIKWVAVMTEMGRCHTFNSVLSAYQSFDTWKLRMTKKNAIAMTVKEENLLTCRYIEGKCFARFDIINSTGKYYVHSPFEIAETTSNPTDTVEEGQELDAQYRYIQILAEPQVKSLTVSQRKCRYSSESISKKIPTYSNKLCHMACRTKMAMMFCGCRPFFYTMGEGKPCDISGMSCIGRHLEILINMPMNLAKCQCYPQCSEINYVQYNRKLMGWNITQETIFDRRSSVRFALQMPEILLTKGVIFTFEDLIASFGGAGGLFLGISFVSVMELLIWICQPCRRSLEEKLRNIKITRKISNLEDS